MPFHPRKPNHAKILRAWDSYSCLLPAQPPSLKLDTPILRNFTSPSCSAIKFAPGNSGAAEHSTLQHAYFAAAAGLIT